MFPFHFHELETKYLKDKPEIRIIEPSLEKVQEIMMKVFTLWPEKETISSMKDLFFISINDKCLNEDEIIQLLQLSVRVSLAL